VVCCEVRLSEVGLSEIRKPQVVRSIRIAGSISSLVIFFFSHSNEFNFVVHGLQV
jgi:hypothetical protein